MSTPEDTTPPQLVGMPKDGQPAAGDLVFTFNEAIQAGSGKLSLYLLYGAYTPVFSADIAGSTAITISGNTLTLHLTQRLEYATNYAVSFDAGAIKDLAGNAFTASGIFNYFRSGLSPVALNLTGTDNADTLNGSDLADTLSGGAGNDTISGYGGDDLLNGGDEANDYAYSFNGDYLYGGAGNDTLYGGSGHDQLSGDDGNDLLYGGAGNDGLNGGAGDDLLEGAAGNDRLYDDGGLNTLRGGDGDDYLDAGFTGRGLLDGGAGNDTLTGSDLANYIAGDGNDQISVWLRSIGAAASTIDAGDGNDTIGLTMFDHSTGRVSVSGGSGIDTYVLHANFGLPDSSARIDVGDFKPGAGGDRINVFELLDSFYEGNPFKNGTLKLVADGADTLLQVQLPYYGTWQTLLHLNNLQPGQLTADNFVGGIDPGGSSTGLTLTGTAGNDSLAGNIMDDVLSGLEGADNLFGNNGNDSLDGGAGNDVLDGGRGNDTLAGGLGDDHLTDSVGDNTLLGGAGNDQLTSYSAGTNLLDGGAGNDTLWGGYGKDVLHGGDGDDTLDVSNWNVLAEQRTVTVSGDAGKDLLIFHDNSNAGISASGGDGADTFRFASGADFGKITITDFSAAEGDQLDLLQLLPYDLASNPFGAAKRLTAVQTGSDVTISYDRDGTGSAYGPTPVVTLKNTSLASLTPNAFVGGFDAGGGTRGLLLTGTAGADTLTGGWLDDTLSGGDGRDSIDGGPGDDSIDGGDESVLGAGDMLKGGYGNDVIHGGTGADTLAGGGGNDSLDGGDGHDRLEGGAGNDTLDGGAGDDVLSDNSGSNILHGGAGNDTIDALWNVYAGYDSTFGTPGDNTLDGGEGNDYLRVGRGNDVVTGGAGNDTIAIELGSYGSVRIVADGGDGDDVITLSANAVAGAIVEASGGNGRDTYSFSPYYLTPNVLTIKDFQAGPGGDVLDVLSLMSSLPSGNPFGTLGYLRLKADGDDTQVEYDSDGAAGLLGFQTIAVLKGVAPASLTGDNFPQGIRPDGSSTGMTIAGTAQADSIKGGLLDDTIAGGAGNDSIEGGPGADLIHGGEGNDTLTVTVGNSQLFGDDGDDYLNGAYYYSSGVGNDTLSGGAGNDNLQTWTGDNVMNGDGGDDFLYSFGSGRNLLSGGAGNDMLSANVGDDTLDGGDGDDTLSASSYIYTGTPKPGASYAMKLLGGSGRDIINLQFSGNTRVDITADGGSGSDLFRISDHPLKYGYKSTLTIEHFEAGPGGDLIDLSGLVSSGKNPFAAGGALQVVQRGTDTAIVADPDGDGPLALADVLVIRNVDKSTLTADNFWNGFNPDGSSTGIRLTGTDGNDKLKGGWLDDTISGGLGNDVLLGSYGNDSIDGGDGDDTLSGEEDTWTHYGVDLLNGSDMLFGGAGNDELYSYSGNDTLDGGAGNDTFTIVDDYPVGSNRDIVARGGDGDDVFSIVTYALPSATQMSVSLTGGAGKDSFLLPAGEPRLKATITDFQAGAGGDVLDAFDYWNGTTPFSSGWYRFVQRGADAVLQFDKDGPSGSAAFVDVVTLQNVDWTKLLPENTAGWPADGSTKGQLIGGSDNNDKLAGGPLDDTITGGLGNDGIDGRGGNDSIDGGDGDDVISGGPGNDTLSGGAGGDLIDATEGNDLALGGAGNDYLIASMGKTTLDGGDGDDLLEVEPSNTMQAHAITLLGGAGDDIFLVGGWTNVDNPIVATGGAGRDLFKLDPGKQGQGGRYTITDFQAGANGDRIEFGPLASNFAKGIDPFGDGHLRLVQNGSDTLLQYDFDGSAGAYGKLQTLLTLKNVDAYSLTAANFVEAVTPPAPPPPPPPPVVVIPPPPPAIPGITNTGGETDDKLEGSVGDDSLDGGEGNDLLHGGSGTDLLAGGKGKDIALYGGKLENYKITHDDKGWHVADQRTGSDSDGNDTLLDVERLQFTDHIVALDIDGVPAQAYRLYRAAFDREPDLAGLGYWLERLEAGASLVNVADGFTHSQEFADLYGTAPTNAEIVTRLYHNILHRAPDVAGYAYWLDILDSKKATLNYVLGFMSDSDENIAAVAELIAKGIAYTPYGAPYGT